MKEKTIEILYHAWAEGEFGRDDFVQRQANEILHRIYERLQVSKEDIGFVEDSVSEIAAGYEEMAFMAGLEMGLALKNM